MNYIYFTPLKLWAIVEQDDFFEQEKKIYSIYKFYPKQGLTPFKFIGSDLKTAFRWLYSSHIISKDEYEIQFSLLTGGN